MSNPNKDTDNLTSPISGLSYSAMPENLDLSELWKNAQETIKEDIKSLRAMEQVSLQTMSQRMS